MDFVVAILLAYFIFIIGLLISWAYEVNPRLFNWSDKKLEELHTETLKEIEKES